MSAGANHKEQRIIAAIKEKLSSKYFSMEEIQKAYSGKFNQKQLNSLLKKNILSECVYDNSGLVRTFYYLTEEKDQLQSFDHLILLKEYGLLRIIIV